MQTSTSAKNLDIQTYGILSAAELSHLLGPYARCQVSPGKSSNPHLCWRIPGAHVFGGSVAAAGVVRDDTFFCIRESAVYDVELHAARVLQTATRWNVDRELHGDWFLLSTAWSRGFWHWVMEALPRIEILESLGYGGGYLVPAGPAFIKESLELMGIPASRIHTVREEALRIEALWVMSPFYGGSSFEAFPGLMFSLRDRLLNASRQQGSEPQESRLYIARAVTRRIVNEAELQACIEPYGFHTRHLMERYPLAEQIRRVSGAEVVIGPHGAGMALTMFMPPRSTVIELFPPTYVNPCMTATARQLRQRFHMLVSSIHVPYSPYPNGTDIVANLPAVAQILDSLEP